MCGRDMNILGQDAPKMTLLQKYLIFQKRKKKGAPNRFTDIKQSAFYRLFHKQKMFHHFMWTTSASNKEQMFIPKPTRPTYKITIYKISI
jgi:hypothetical protein